MSDDIKERLLKWYNLTGIEAVARIEALEAALASSQKFVREGCDIANDLRSQLARTQAQLAMRNSDLDECEAQLAAAREALERVVQHDPRNSALHYDTIEGLLSSAIDVAKDALLALRKDTDQ